MPLNDFNIFIASQHFYDKLLSPNKAGLLHQKKFDNNSINYKTIGQ